MGLGRLWADRSTLLHDDEGAHLELGQHPLAQGLGLPNDSPRARPSIFNDDEEFALLTRMDEDMLRILYNPALRPGMSEAEARPIIYDLATKLVGGGS